MILMAVCAVCGGVDRILGNRFGLGKRFEEGFMLLGPIALSMAGIMCLMPALSAVLEKVIAPPMAALGIDPGVFGGLLAIDMGGYPLAMSLARDPAVGRFAGIVIGGTFGCTLVFTIPVGMGLVPKGERPLFARGLLVGLIALPAALLAGGMMSGLGLGNTLRQCLPVFILAAILLWSLLRHPVGTTRAFGMLARFIEIITTLGLMLGAVQFMTGSELPIPLTPLDQVMPVVCSIATVLLGGMPLAELLQRALRRPFTWLGRRTGMNLAGATGLLVGIISVTPALGMFAGMDGRSKVVNAAALVCGASALTAHFAFTIAVEPEMTAALLVTKGLGAAAAVALALFFTRDMKPAGQENTAK